MKLAQLDVAPGYVGSGPIAGALRWLETLLNSPAVKWDADQHDAARHTLDSAREVMAADVLTLAGRRPGCLAMIEPDASSSDALAALDDLMRGCRNDGHVLTYRDLQNLRGYFV